MKILPKAKLNPKETTPNSLTINLLPLQNQV
jgi:hypothetical protein